jgi:hypothetical protein
VNPDIWQTMAALKLALAVAAEKLDFEYRKNTASPKYPFDLRIALI